MPPSNGFLWTKDKGTQRLIPFGTDVFSVALAVNDERDVTGRSGFPSTSAPSSFYSAFKEGKRRTTSALTLVSQFAELYITVALSEASRGMHALRCTPAKRNPDPRSLLRH